MDLLMIDNYDSFTYNLVQYIGEMGVNVHTVRNDDMTAREMIALDPQAVVVSPGPCTPAQAGESLAAIAAFAGKVPILGVCLGHQAIGMHFGAHLVRSDRVMHGKVDTISHSGVGVFSGLPSSLDVVRYHSLSITNLPDVLEPIAHSSDGQVMGIRHREFDIEGVQFHPESIESEFGHQMLLTFLHRAGLKAKLPAQVSDQ